MVNTFYPPKNTAVQGWQYNQVPYKWFQLLAFIRLTLFFSPLTSCEDEKSEAYSPTGPEQGVYNE